MPWYSVSLLFKSTHLNEPEVSPLWEESIILIKANSEEEARRESIRIGKEAEHEYSVLYDQKEKLRGTVKWTFEQIESIYQVEKENLAHGTELFSRFLRDSEVKSILTPFED